MKVEPAGPSAAAPGISSRSKSAFKAPSPFAALLSATKVDALLNDANGDGAASPGDTLRYTVTITNSGDMDATGVVFTDTIDPNTTLVPGSVKASPVAVDDFYAAIGNVFISPNASQGMLSNDADPDGGLLTVTSVNTTGTEGQVTFNPDGSFTFNPNPGFEGTTTFTYTASDPDGNTSTAVVTINVNGMIWFVDSSAPPGGDGRLSSPFNALTGPGSFDAVAADDPGDNIFLYSGSYTGGLTLKPNQRLIGQGAMASLSTITGLTPQPYSAPLPPTGGASPVINAAVDNITLSTDNTVRGVTLNNTGATALVGNNFGNLSVADTSVSNTGGVAINLNTGNPTASFTSVSATGGTNGIILANTSGSFAVTGTGTPGSGGTIASTTGADGSGDGIGVSLTNASNVSLASMQIINHSNFAIFGSNVTGFSLSDSTVGGINGTSSALDEGSISFTNLLGNSSISGSAISGGHEDNLRIANSGGTLALTITNTTLSNNNPLTGNSGLNLQAFSSANVSLSVSNSAFNNHTGDGMLLSLLGASTTTLVVDGNSFDNNADGIDLITDGDADLDYTITNNTFLGQNGNPILVGSGTATTTLSQTDGTISNNTIGNPALIDSGSEFARGISLDYRGNGTAVVAITNNTISHTDAEGIFVTSRLNSIANTGSLQLTITNNVVNAPDDNGVFPLGAADGISVTSRNSRTTCLNLSGNTSAGSGTGAGFRLRRLNTAVFQIQGLTPPTGATAAQVKAFVESQNTGTAVVEPASPAGVYTAGTCSTPSFAMLRQEQEHVRDEKFSATTIDKTGGWMDDLLPVANGERHVNASLVALSEAELGQIVRAAIARLGAAGFEADDLARLERLQFEIADLDDDVLATGLQGGVKIDATAAGHGWFVDATPEDDSEFRANIGEGGRRAKRSAAHFRQVDLLTVVMREMVHTLSQEHRWSVNRLRGSLGMTLQTGVRYTPEARSIIISIPAAPPKVVSRLHTPTGIETVDSNPVAASLVKVSARPGQIVGRVNYPMITRPSAVRAVSPMSGETVTLNIGVLPAGGTTTITFEVTIDNPLPAGVCEVANQGTVTADGGISVVTDDPDTPAPNDATRTVVPVAPAITCPENISVSNDPGQCSASVSFSATATGCPLPTVTCRDENNVVITSPHTFPVGTTVVTCTASSPSGPDATCSFTVTVNDTEPPSQIVCPENISETENPSGSGTAVVNYATPTATDNCSVTVTCDPPSGSAFPVGETTVTCTAADPANNTTTCSFTVTVIAACQITCPASVTVSNDTNQCGAVVNYPAPAATAGCGTVTCTPESGSFFPKGSTTVLCTTATGPSCSFTVTVNDTQPPSLTCPANITQPADPNQCGATVNYSPSASDNCPGLNVACMPASGSFFPKGSTTVQCTATDASGNTSTCSFTVTVVDTQPPVITCPANISVGTGSNQCSAVVSYPAPTVSDNCPGPITVACTPTSGSVFPKGTTTVSCTATDSSGNTSSCSFTVTVTDAHAPTLACSVAITDLWPPNHNLINVGLSVTATDNCGNPAVSVAVFSDEDDLDDGSHSPDAKDIAPGTLRLRSERSSGGDGRVYLIVVTATDSSGNVTRCCKTVTVAKSRSSANQQSVAAQAAAAEAYCHQNGAPPPNFFLVGDGPVVGPKQ